MGVDSAAAAPRWQWVGLLWPGVAGAQGGRVWREGGMKVLLGRGKEWGWAGWAVWEVGQARGEWGWPG